MTAPSRRARRSGRNSSRAARSARSRCVAATTRRSIFTGRVAPTGITSLSCSTRSRVACAGIGKSPISSSSSVPRSLLRTNPARSSMAPVKALLRWPNSSDSPQFTATNGPGRPESSWMADAISSFPVPLSPRTSTGTRERANATTRCRVAANAGDRVAIPRATGRKSRLSRKVGSARGSPSRKTKKLCPSSSNAPPASGEVVTRLPSIRVPFFDPRSSITQLPSTLCRRA